MNKKLERALAKLVLDDPKTGIYRGYLTPVEVMAIIKDGGELNTRGNLEMFKEKVKKGESGSNWVYLKPGFYKPFKDKDKRNHVV